MQKVNVRYCVYCKRWFSSKKRFRCTIKKCIIDLHRDEDIVTVDESTLFYRIMVGMAEVDAHRYFDSKIVMNSLRGDHKAIARKDHLLKKWDTETAACIAIHKLRGKY